MSLPEPRSEVVERARRGDPQAFGEIVRIYERMVYNFAFRMSFNREDAIDMTQEVFLRLFRNFGKFEPSRGFGAWFMRLAVNVCINERRGRTRRSSLVQADSAECESRPAATAEIGKDRILRAVADLNPSYRAVVMLRYIEDLSYGEVGRILGLPEGTVKNRLFRAREVLRARLEKVGVDG